MENKRLSHGDVYNSHFSSSPDSSRVEMFNNWTDRCLIKKFEANDHKKTPKKAETIRLANGTHISSIQIRIF